jgi:hypothetical protein
MLLAAVVALLPALAVAQGPLRRCFTCRSRGEQGDCRDPFTPPTPGVPGLPAPAHKTAVFETPCSSGIPTWTFGMVSYSYMDLWNGFKPQWDVFSLEMEL